LQEDGFSPAINAKMVLTKREVLILDESDFGKRLAVDKEVVAKSMGLRVPDQIKHICVFDGARTWKRDDHSNVAWFRLPAIWPEVRIVDFSKCGLCSIGEASFIYSSKLVEVFLPDTLTEIGRRCFYYCGSLKVVKVGNGLKTLGEYALYYCRSLIGIILPDTVTEVGNDALSYCSSLKVVKFGKGLKTLGAWALNACRGLIEIVLSDTVKEVGNYALSDCGSLKVVKFGKGLKTLGKGSLSHRENLIEIVIPQTVAEGTDGSVFDCGDEFDWDCDYCRSGRYNGGIQGCPSLKSLSFVRVYE
jgi:hypothetical protein